MLLALVGVFSACKEEEKEEPKETPKPEQTKTNFTFWTDDDYGHGTYTVNLWNDDDYDKTYTVTKYYDDITPDCGADGCANFKSLEPGTYYYYATTEDEMYYWEDEVTLTKECYTMLLYISNAKFNSNAQPREVSKLEAGSMDFDMNNILK